jgi:hypothetical protein
VTFGVLQVNHYHGNNLPQVPPDNLASFRLTWTFPLSVWVHVLPVCIVCALLALVCTQTVWVYFNTCFGTIMYAVTSIMYDYNPA